MGKSNDKNMNMNLWGTLGFDNTMIFNQNDIESVIVSIIDNLHNTLNARCRKIIDMKSKKMSVCLSHGLPDLFFFNPGSDGQYQLLCQMLQTHIQQHEPRLQKIEVISFTNEKSTKLRLHFKIRGIFKSHEKLHSIQLESILNFDQLQFFIQKEAL